MKRNLALLNRFLPISILLGYILGLGLFTGPSNALAVTDHRIIAYYFHGNYRCTTCKTIEKLSREAILKNFRKELEDGILFFNVVNVEEPQNTHFVNDFGLFTRSLVLVEKEDGKVKKYKNLNRIWTLVRDADTLKKYVKDEISTFIKEAETRPVSTRED